MKRLLPLIITCFSWIINAQEMPKQLRAYEPSEQGWGVGTEFRTTTGMVGSHWDVRMRVLYFDGTHILTIIRPASDDYFRIYEGDNCYLKLNTEEIVELPILKDFGVWNYYQPGYFVGNTHMPGRYITQMFYKIPDISILSKYNIVKIRYFVNHSPRDIDIEVDGNINKFNKNIKESTVTAEQNYKATQIFEDNPTAGF